MLISPRYRKLTTCSIWMNQKEIFFNLHIRSGRLINICTRSKDYFNFYTTMTEVYVSNWWATKTGSSSLILLARFSRKNYRNSKHISIFCPFISLFFSLFHIWFRLLIRQAMFAHFQCVWVNKIMSESPTSYLAIKVPFSVVV